MARVHWGDPNIKNCDAGSVDACQIDDFMLCVVAAVLGDSGKRVKIYSHDGRFRSQILQLPRIHYPFYCVVQTFADEFGTPIYQRDSKVLYESINDRIRNPNYVQPYAIDVAPPIYLEYVNTKSVMLDRYGAWSTARTNQPRLHTTPASVGADYNFIESPVSGLSESDYNPVEELEHGLEIGVSDCSSVQNAPAMRPSHLQTLQRKAGARRHSHRA
jgi:hypothetical protein